MPQIILKNIGRETAVSLAPMIAETTAEIISVPANHIVVEYSEVSFFRGGMEDIESAMAWIYWKKRTPDLQKAVADALGEILLKAGFAKAEIVYSNLDMNDFYEYE